MANMVQLIKQAAIEANEATKPTAIVFGVVDSISPFRINIDQKLNLTKEFLIFMRQVTDYVTELTVELDTKSAGGPEVHQHKIHDKSKVTIHNGLKKGDNVILLRLQGGQKYIVVDKVGE